MNWIEILILVGKVFFGFVGLGLVSLPIIFIGEKIHYKKHPKKIDD